MSELAQSLPGIRAAGDGALAELRDSFARSVHGRVLFPGANEDAVASPST